MKLNHVACVDEEPVGTSVSSTDVVDGAAVVVVVVATPAGVTVTELNP